MLPCALFLCSANIIYVVCSLKIMIVHDNISKHYYSRSYALVNNVG